MKWLCIVKHKWMEFSRDAAMQRQCTRCHKAQYWENNQELRGGGKWHDAPWHSVLKKPDADRCIILRDRRTKISKVDDQATTGLYGDDLIITERTGGEGPWWDMAHKWEWRYSSIN